MAIIYIAINSFFAVLYLLVPNSIDGVDLPSLFDAFFFSFQTYALSGYSVTHPQTLYANIINTIEAFVSLFALAIVRYMVGPQSLYLKSTRN